MNRLCDVELITGVTLGCVRTEACLCPPGAAPKSPLTLTDIILLIHAEGRSFKAKQDTGEEDEDNQHRIQSNMRDYMEVENAC